MDIGVFGSPTTVRAMIDEVRGAAADGMHSFWTPQIFGLDALTALAMAGAEVPDIRLGTSVVPIQPRHPMTMAAQALTVSQVIGDRLDLGIGLSHQPVVEGMWGLPFDRPATHMDEYLDALVPLLAGEDPDVAASQVTMHGAIGVPDAPTPTVLVAALGARMLRIAGTKADGTTTWMVGPATVAEHTAPTINAAAEAAGRPEPQVVVALPTCVTDDADAARERAAREFAIYGMLPSYRAMLDREGVDGPADVALIGNAAEVAARIATIGDAGATSFVGAEFGTGDDRVATRALLKELAA